MTEHTPEKVADLIAEARSRTYTPSRPAMLVTRLADALAAVSAGRDADRAEHVRRWANVIKANGTLIDRLSGVEAERDEALAVIAEVLANPNGFEWDVPPTAKAILSRIPEHPKED